MHFYAQIDDDGVCYAVTQTAGPISAPDMVPIPDFDLTYIGRTYSGGAWV